MAEKHIAESVTTKGIGDRFQQETKYDPEKMEQPAPKWRPKPDTFKNYEHALAIVPLPKPDLSSEAQLWNLLLHRRSRRSYESGKPLGLSLLASLLWAAQGVTSGRGPGGFRTAPSAGALYPVETYLFARNVEDLKKGIYHFRPQNFDLEYIRQGDLSREIASAALGQNMTLHAPATFLWSAVVERCRHKYSQRAYRYIYLDAGHIAQNLYLAAEALGLGACSVAAFFDDPINRLLGIDGIEETIIYMATVGWPR